MYLTKTAPEGDINILKLRALCAFTALTPSTNHLDIRRF